MLPNMNILALNPVSGLVATSASTSSIQLTWGEVTDATSYNIYRSLTENGTYTLITNVTTTNYTDTGLIQNTTYYYRVEAINETESGTLTAPVSATTIAIEAPSNVAVTETTATSIVLNWTAVTNAERYNIYRATNAIGPYVLINTTTGTTYTDTGLTPNTTYYYQITTVQDNVEGKTSNPLEAKTEALPVPATPIDITATVQSSNTILLSWTPSINATYYTIYRSISPNGTFEVIGTTTTPTFLDTNLQPETTYYYQVNATNTSGSSSNSTTVSATTLPQTITTTELIATTLSCNKISLTWTAISNATTYLVFRSRNNDGPFSLIATTSNTNYLDCNLISNTTYYYQIIPYINTTADTPSNIASATTLYNNCCNICYCYNQCCYKNWFW